MNKLYDLITFHNNTTPALNEDNLNAMSEALDAIDDRVVSLGGAVLEVIPDLEDILSNAQQLQQYRDDAVAAATSAESDEEDAEAYAVGTRGGVPVAPTDPTYHNNAKYYSEQTNPDALANMTDVDITSPTAGQVLKYNATSQKWENGAGGGGGTSADDVSYDNTTSGLTATNVQDAIDEVNTKVGTKASTTDVNNKHKITQKAVDITSGWTQDSTSQSGSTFYKKQITLNHIYVDSPTVEIGAYNAVLPTTAQQTTYDYLRYVTVDDTVPCIYLYADENMMSDSDRTSFYIDIEGVD